jgi:hypothetical protein
MFEREYCAQDDECMDLRQRRHSHKNLDVKFEEKRPLGKRRRVRRIVLTFILRE